MQERESIDPFEGELAAELRQLQPASMRTSREQVWYRAGLEVGRRRANRWRALAACMAVAAGVALATRPGGRGTADAPRLAQRPAAPVAQGEGGGEGGASAAYLRLRDAVAQNGLAGLGPVETGGGAGSVPPAPRGWPLEF